MNGRQWGFRREAYINGKKVLKKKEGWWIRGNITSRLAAFIKDYRFMFNPIRFTSLGPAVIEAMIVGLPIAALATTEIVATACYDLLIDGMQPSIPEFALPDPEVHPHRMRNVLNFTEP